jgi:hypothetical protein
VLTGSFSSALKNKFTKKLQLFLGPEARRTFTFGGTIRKNKSYFKKAKNENALKSKTFSFGLGMKNENSLKSKTFLFRRTCRKKIKK